MVTEPSRLPPWNTDVADVIPPTTPAPGTNHVVSALGSHAVEAFALRCSDQVVARTVQPRACRCEAHLGRPVVCQFAVLSVDYPGGGCGSIVGNAHHRSSIEEAGAACLAEAFSVTGGNNGRPLVTSTPAQPPLRCGLAWAPGQEIGAGSGRLDDEAWQPGSVQGGDRRPRRQSQVGDVRLPAGNGVHLHGRQECFLRRLPPRACPVLGASGEPPSDGAGDRYDYDNDECADDERPATSPPTLRLFAQGLVLVCVSGGEDLRLIGEHRLSGWEPQAHAPRSYARSRDLPPSVASSPRRAGADRRGHSDWRAGQSVKSLRPVRFQSYQPPGVPA